MFELKEEEDKDTIINLFKYKTEADFLESELMEIGRIGFELPYLKKKMKLRSANHEEKQAYEIVRKVVYTLFGRFSKFEKPNGGSFYRLVINLYNRCSIL